MKCLSKLLLLLVSLCFRLRVSSAANILAFAIIPSYSHQMPVLGITKALAARGHNVTVITANPSKERIPNHTEIDVSASYELAKGGGRALGLSMTGKIPPFTLMKQALYGMPIICETQLKSEPVQNFIRWAKDVQFDVVLYENMWLSSYLGLAHVLSPRSPVIAVSTVESNLPYSTTMGSSLNLAYAPILMPFSDHMTFFERLTNVAMFFWFLYHRNWHTYPEHDRIVREVFGEGLPSVEEMERNVSLVMYCASGSMYYPHALTPNMVKIGPTHIDEPKPLPEDLEKWVSGAIDGVILFSLGSNMQGIFLSIELREAFLSVFSQLKTYRVIWKWESDEYVPGQPDNVIFKKWIPQQDVLAHSKVKLFITQGGLQSLEESVHYGVPMVGIPLFADQNPNMRKLETVEAAVRLDFDYLNKDTISSAVNAVLHDPKYRHNMRRLSDISKDTVLKSRDQAIWWVEYIIRHSGAHHLRPAPLDLHWTQYYLLDIAMFVITVVCVIVFGMFKLSQLICRRFSSQTVNRLKPKQS